MTEFKKLTLLVQELREDVDAIAGIHHGDDNVGTAVMPDVPALHARAEKVREAVASGTPRMHKIVLKARETDPNRQIYNEAMCAKIEDLFSAFCSEVARLVLDGRLEEEEGLAMLTESFVPSDTATSSSPSPSSSSPSSSSLPYMQLLDSAPALQQIDSWHDAYILQQAASEEWAQRVAGDLTELTTFEKQCRDVALVEEKQSRAEALESARVDRLAVMEVLRLREEAKWHAELQRRQTECAQLASSSEAVAAVGLAAFLSESLQGRTRTHFAARMRGLCEALLSTPEDINIRKLRNNNQHFMSHFGHPCLHGVAHPGGGACACSSVVHAAEVVWHMMGYRIQYSRQSVPPIHALLQEGAISDVMLPCGGLLSVHAYTKLGFEDYSERFLELQEPDAFGQPDQWVAWHEAISHMSSVLREMQ